MPEQIPGRVDLQRPQRPVGNGRPGVLGDGPLADLRDRQGPRRGRRGGVLIPAGGTAAAYPSEVSNSNLWSPIGGPGSKANVVAVFSAWLAEHGWVCADRPAHGDRPDIEARHAGGRRLVVEAKGFTRDSGADLDTGYGQLLRRMNGEPATAYALVVAGTVVRFAQRVPSDVRRRLGISLYTVDAAGKVNLVDGTPL